MRALGIGERKIRVVTLEQLLKRFDILKICKSRITISRDLLLYIILYSIVLTNYSFIPSLHLCLYFHISELIVATVKSFFDLTLDGICRLSSLYNYSIGFIVTELMHHNHLPITRLGRLLFFSILK